MNIEKTTDMTDKTGDVHTSMKIEEIEVKAETEEIMNGIEGYSTIMAPACQVLEGEAGSL